MGPNEIGMWTALRLSWRVWCEAVAAMQRQDLLDEMREVYTETLLDWREDDTLAEAGLIAERDQALRERDAAVQERDHELRVRDDLRHERDRALRELHAYRRHVQTLELEIDGRRPQRPSDFHKLGSAKWVKHLKDRCAAKSRLLLTDRPS